MDPLEGTSRDFMAFGRQASEEELVEDVWLSSDEGEGGGDDWQETEEEEESGDDCEETWQEAESETQGGFIICIMVRALSNEGGGLRKGTLWHFM